jgi:hypothetical protein
MHPTKFRYIWPSSFRWKDFKNRPIKSKNCLLGQMEPNLAVSIYVRSSINFLHFVPFHQQIWRQGQLLFLIGYCLWLLISFWSLTNMAATGNSYFWLAYFWKSFPQKLLGQMYQSFVGCIYERSSMVIRFTSKLQGMQILTSWTCFQFTLKIYLL